MIKFTIPIIPKAQMRAKATARGRFAGIYKDPQQVKNENHIIALMLPYKPDKPLEGALFLCVTAYLPIPQSKPNKWKVGAQGGNIRPITKPDIDNIYKMISDCMTQLSFWHDDAQVVSIKTDKWYTNNPRWEVELVSV